MLTILGWIFICIFAILLPVGGPIFAAVAFNFTFGLTAIETFGIFGLLIFIQAVIHIITRVD